MCKEFSNLNKDLHFKTLVVQQGSTIFFNNNYVQKRFWYGKKES
jgi:hypothetical protein